MVHRHMSRRSRQSKLRSRRSRQSKLRSRHTIRRGGRNCSGINKADFRSQMHAHIEIIKGIMADYDNDPHSVFTEQVRQLTNEHCEEFLKELDIVIRDVFPTNKENPLYRKENEKLIPFRIAMERRAPSLIEENLRIT
jgi:hypothetical protein